MLSVVADCESVARPLLVVVLSALSLWSASPSPSSLPPRRLPCHFRVLINFPEPKSLWEEYTWSHGVSSHEVSRQCMCTRGRYTCTATLHTVCCARAHACILVKMRTHTRCVNTHNTLVQICTYAYVRTIAAMRCPVCS